MTVLSIVLHSRSPQGRPLTFLVMPVIKPPSPRPPRPKHTHTQGTFEITLTLTRSVDTYPYFPNFEVNQAVCLHQLLLAPVKKHGLYQCNQLVTILL